MYRRSRSATSLASVLGLLVSIGACGVGCGGGSGTDTGTGTGDDTGAAADGAGDGSPIEAGDDTTPADTGGGSDSGGGSDAVDSGGGTDTGGGADTTGDDTGAVDSGPADTGPADTGPADTGPADTGALDAGDTGASDSDTGPADTGPDPCGTGACTVDTDGDTIPDSVEGACAVPPVDTDKDGIPDYLDLDSDGDGIPDKAEWFAGGCDPTSPGNDADGDGIPNFRDLDSDGNGLTDALESCPPAAVLTIVGKPACVGIATPYDFDGDGIPDYLDSDNDHDSKSATLTVGLEDKYELTNASGIYVGLVDTDGDGIPDVYDRDSDNDTIADLDDGIADFDKDGKQNFRDTDSDGDGVPDKCEARAKAAPPVTDISLPVLDTDGDGKPDFLDLDSDNDLLTDGKEDLNFNCIVDACETDRLKADTDGDGISDFIEVTLDTGTPKGCWASDPTMTPAKAGKFYFIEPYAADGSLPPSPTSSKLALSTQLQKGDVGFIIDTTGSMGGEITNLKSSLSTTIIPALKVRIPSLGVGVAAHDDVPVTPFGSAGCDLPFYFTATPQGYVTTITADSQTAANALTTHCGYDGSESQVPAIYHAITGAGITWPGGSVAAVTPPAGTFGAMHFRADAFPIVIEITDISHHNGKRALDKTGTTYDAAYQDVYSFATWNVDNVVTKMNALGAKYIGVAADNGSRLMGAYDPYGYHAYIADKTNSDVPPSSFTGGTCNTGVSGAAVAADGPTIGGVKQCRSVFSINTTGTGLSTSIVDGVVAVLNTVKFDVYVQAYNDAAETTDVVGNFMLKVEPDPTGGTDPVTGGVCLSFPVAQLGDNFTGPKALIAAADGVNDTIKQVNPGPLYCFNVTPKANKVVAATAVAQTFRAWLKVLAIKPTGGTFTLGPDREVLFIVPPLLN